MKYKLAEIENYFEKMTEFVDYYENSKIENKSFSLYTSSGEQVRYKITKESIPHILGIDTNKLQGSNLYKTTNSYELFKEMIGDPYRVYKYLKEHPNNNFLSDHIDKKLENFYELCHMDIEKIEFLCSYKTYKTYAFKENPYWINYIIVLKKDDGKYAVYDLVKTENDICAVKSNKSYNNEDDLYEGLSDYLESQDITTVTGFRQYDKIKGLSEPFYLYNFKKQEKLNNCLDIAKKLNATVDVKDDYSRLLSIVCRHTNNYHENNNMLDLIIKCIKTKKVIKEKDLDVNSFDELGVLSELVYAINDFVCSSEIGDSNVLYSDMQKQNSELKKKNKELLEENKSNVKEIEALNISLEETKKIKDAAEDKIEEVKKILF